jgi:hypothetical protein
MRGHRYTPAKFALQQKVKSFGNLLSQRKDYQLTHIYHVVFLFGQYEDIRYLVP